MGSDWETMPLGNAAKLVGGFAFKSQDFIPEGIPVIKIKNIRHRDIDITDVDYVSKETAEKCSRFLIKHGDVLISMTGSGIQAPASIVGRVARHNGADDSFIINQRVGRFDILKPDCLHPRFLYYYFSQREIQLELVSIATGSANQVNLSASQIESFDIPFPPLLEQKAIAHILGSLDDKIELNRRMNATLEGMAQSLFKSWFVDFDPVIDNALAAGNPIPEELAERAEVRSQALADGTANRAAAKQFPAAFQLTEEMGWIPEGWACKQWGDIAKLEYGKSLTGYRDGEGTIPVFGTNGAIGLTDKAICNSDGIVIGRKGAYRGVHYSSVPFYVIDTAFYLVPKSCVSKKWAYYEILRFDINGMDSGSAIPSTSRDDFYSLWSTLPAPIAQTEFDRIVSSFYERKASNNKLNASLTNLRDTLLPKLISGELRIPEAEKIIEEVRV